MKSTVIVMIGCLMIGGCAAVSEPPRSIDYVNPRIVYRDLTLPVIDPASQSSSAPVLPESNQPAKVSASNQPSHFIEFGNDSSKNFDEKGLQAFIEKTPVDATILVLGHSHGSSAVGTLTLATRRAQSVLGYLAGRGYDNVHAMAAWGGRTVSFSPNRGVQLYVLDAGGDQVSIAFSKQTKKEPYNVSPERIDTLADHRTDQGGLDNV